MREFHLALAVVLLASLVGGLLRILRGPTRSDRMLAAQLFGTTGVAVLLVLAEAMDQGSLRDVALVFSLLAAVNATVFVRGVGPTPPDAGGSAPPRARHAPDATTEEPG